MNGKRSTWSDHPAHKPALQTYHPTSTQELESTAALFADVWGRPIVSAQILTAVVSNGGYVSTAHRGDGDLLGAAFAFIAKDAATTFLYSHLLAVASAARGQGVGYLLKQDQLNFARETGLPFVRWTFDPLIRRNGHFNLNKLGARITGFVPSFYGDMPDAINAGDDSDRCIITWPATTQTRQVPAGEAVAALEDVSEAVAVLEYAGDGGPRLLPGPHGPTASVRIPADYGKLRSSDRRLAQRWRTATKEALLLLTGRGYQGVAMTRDGRYLFQQRDLDAGAA